MIHARSGRRSLHGAADDPRARVAGGGGLCAKEAAADENFGEQQEDSERYQQIVDRAVINHFCADRMDHLGNGGVEAAAGLRGDFTEQ